MSDFASEIRALRKARGLSQRRVAELLGVTTVTVWNWEAGRVAPWPKKQAAILHKLGEAGSTPTGREYTVHEERGSTRFAAVERLDKLGEHGNADKQLDNRVARDGQAGARNVVTRNDAAREPGQVRSADSARMAGPFQQVRARRRLIDNVGE
jgi:transcriptional regulator with XRE-family HTH domain